jgi:uncharacterized membrane protein (UPF0127 family)
MQHWFKLFVRSFFIISVYSFSFFFSPLLSAENSQDTEKLMITTSSGKHIIAVEVAKTKAQQVKGLMFRQTMPRHHGMLFIFNNEKTVSMWMKNTYIPLDMIFVSKTGLVTDIAHDTTPFSEEIINSAGPAYAVIEVNAGVAREFDVKPGSQVQHPAFIH